MPHTRIHIYAQIDKHTHTHITHTHTHTHSHIHNESVTAVWVGTYDVLGVSWPVEFKQIT